jgi:hypothetical protein
MPKPLSRPKQWAQAVKEAQIALGIVQDAKTALLSHMEILEGLRAEYEEIRDNVPENLQSSPYYEKLDAIASLDFTSEDLDEIEDAIGEAETAELPLGFGRD